jgi:uncharacterized cupredoxin-like copper-binding protein
MAVLLVATLAVLACGAAASPSPTNVSVDLIEFAVAPSTTSAPAGKITFAVTNKGPKDTHEFVVVKTDLDPLALPTDATGAVVEDSPGLTVSGEVEDLAVGATENLTVDLAAGKYVLICNIYDETEKEAHYKLGMVVAFTVR